MPQRMNGLSERLLVSHHEHNYGGALRAIECRQSGSCGAQLVAHTPTSDINGLKREELMAAFGDAPLPDLAPELQARRNPVSKWRLRHVRAGSEDGYSRIKAGRGQGRNRATADRYSALWA